MHIFYHTSYRANYKIKMHIHVLARIIPSRHKIVKYIYILTHSNPESDSSNPVLQKHCATPVSFLQPAVAEQSIFESAHTSIER